MSRTQKFRYSAFLFVLIASVIQWFLPSSLFAEETHPITVTCHADSSVVDATVRLGDVGELQFAATIPEEEKVQVSQLPIFSDLAPGEQRTIPGKLIAQRINSLGFLGSKVGYYIPGDVRVQRLGNEVDLMRLKSKLQSAIQSANLPLEIKKVTLPANFRIPATSHQEEVQIGTRESNGTLLFTFIYRSGEEEQRTEGRAIVDGWQEVVTPTRMLKKGEIIRAEDLRVVRLTDGSLSNGHPIKDPSLANGMQLSRQVNAGEVIMEEILAAPTIIQAGSKLVISYQNGPLSLTATGVALQAGSAGQLIRIRNTTSNKILEGKVINSSLAEVAL